MIDTLIVMRQYARDTYNTRTYAPMCLRNVDVRAAVISTSSHPPAYLLVAGDAGIGPTSPAYWRWRRAVLSLRRHASSAGRARRAPSDQHR